MTALQERLGAAMELDALEFDGSAFSQARFGAVRGRIARRRAARSAGIGGASVLGVGAVAFGAGQVPWSGFVLGANPAGSPSVVCTTSSPDAVAEDAANAPDGADYAVTDPATGELAYVKTHGGTLQAWHADGSQWRLVDDGGTAKLTFASGAVLAIPGGGEGELVSLPVNGLSIVHIDPSASRPSSEAPDLAVAWADLDGKEVWTFSQKDGTDTLATAHFEGGTLRVVDFDGTMTDVEPGADGTYVITVGGYQVESTFAAGENTSVTITDVSQSETSEAKAPNYSVISQIETSASLAPTSEGSFTIVSDGGTVVGKASLDGTALVIDTPREGTQRVEPQADGSYHVVVDGKNYVWSFTETGTSVVLTLALGLEGGADISGGEGVIGGSSPSPSVTCVTTTPEPNESASPSASTSPSVAPTAAVSPATDVDSPFQCGFIFDADEYGTDELRVFGAATTDSAIRQVFADWYGNQAPTTEVGDTGSTAYHATLETGSLTEVQVTAADPASIRHDVLPSAVGLSFVAVKDAMVVGVIPTETNNATGLVVDSDGEGAPLEAFLWNTDGLTACGATSVDGADIYAVAGTSDGSAVDYAWTKVSD